MLFSEQVEQQGENDTHYNTGGERKVETKMISFYDDIPWKSAYPGDLIAKGHHKAKEHENCPHHDEHLSHQSETGHRFILNGLKPLKLV